MSIINTALIGKLKKIKADKTNVLELDNNTEYTPITDYNPTTKKYVDDEIAATNRIYMNGRSVEDFTATAGQNTFTTSSSLGLDTEVFYNGIKLDSSDYAVGANDITLIEAAELGDIIQVITYGEIGSLEINYTRSAYTVGTPLNSYDGNLNTFPAVYVVGNVDVFLNGLKLNPAEFTGTNGSTIVLVEDADIDDKIEITSGLPVTGSNYYNKTEVDALVLPATDQGANNFLAGDGTYKSVNGSLSLSSNTLTYTKQDGTTDDIDLSAYLDDTTNTVSSAVLVGNTITFTREDATTFDLDVTNLYDDSNLPYINSGSVSAGTLTLTRNDASTIDIDVTSLLDDTNLVTSVNGSTGAVTIAEYTPPTDQGAGNFLSGDGTYKAVTVPTNVSELTNDSGYITANQSITLTGDVSGSGTTSINVTIADDSHNHIIANVDGLQDALNAAISDTSRNFASGGYQQLSNGLIIQWGGTTTRTYGNLCTSTFTTNFPIVFPNTCWTVTGTTTGSSNMQGNGFAGTFYISSYNASNFTGQFCNPNNGCNTYTTYARWIAVGH